LTVDHDVALGQTSDHNEVRYGVPEFRDRRGLVEEHGFEMFLVQGTVHCFEHTADLDSGRSVRVDAGTLEHAFELFFHGPEEAFR
jgi:hypothetical protein